MKKLLMQILTIPEFGFGDYQYYVITPEDETFYFRTREEAKGFIDFYKLMEKRKNEKVKSTVTQ
jgi:hypothetical protein